MSFSPRQREWLTAMGYALYRPAAVAAGAVAEPPPEGRLLQALRRAARRDDLSGLPLPPWDRLRDDAAAKRALWRQLRVLRRTH